MLKKFKKEMIFLIFFILIMSLLPLGCDDEESTDTGPSVISKVGYVYVPAEPVKDNDGLYKGLIALEQNIPPLDYKPLPGARVSIGNAMAKTGENGSFTVSGLQPGEHQMLVTATGYEPVVQLTAVAATETGTVAIDTMKVIPEQAIVMQDSMMQFIAVGKEPSGKFIPLPAVNWTILTEDKKEVSASISNTGVFTATKSGKYNVVAASGTYNATLEVTALDPASTDTSTLTGKVTLASSSVVEGATVMVFGTNLMAQTDEKGKYAILNVPAGLPLTLFVAKNSTLIGTAPVTVEKWKEKSVDIMATADPPPVQDDTEVAVENSTPSEEGGGTIKGYIFASTLNEKGEESDNFLGLTLIQSNVELKNYTPVQGANIQFENNPAISAISGPDGSFTLNNIPYKGDGGAYFIIVSHDSYGTKRFPALYTGTYPVGVVRSIEIWPDKPVAFLNSGIEFKALFYDRKNQLIESSQVDWSVEGDVGEMDPVNGFFTPSRVGSGTIVAVYGDITERKNFTVISNENTGTLSGTVTDEDGKPVAGAFVITETSPIIAITDDKGFYNISYVPEGEKIALSVKVKGIIVGDAIAAVSSGKDSTEDVNVDMALVQEPPVTAENNQPDNNISDVPPVSIDSDNTSGTDNVGETPENPSEQVEENTEDINGSREEFPRWPTSNEEDKNNNTDNSENEEFPRWPAPTPGNK